MQLFSNEDLQTLWGLYSQVGQDAKDRSFFIQETFPKLFNDEGAIPLNEAITFIKKEAKSEYDLELEINEFKGEESEEEILYLRYLQRDLLKPKGNHLLTFKRVMAIFVVGFLLYLALRGRFF